MLRKDKGAIRSRMSAYAGAFLGGAVQKPRRDGGSPQAEANKYQQINVKSVRGSIRNK